MAATSLATKKAGRGGTLLLALAAGLAAAGAAYLAVSRHAPPVRATTARRVISRPAPTSPMRKAVSRPVVRKIAPGIPLSQRALSITLDPTGGVSEQAKSGDRVDVLATFATGGGQTTTQTILQNAALLGVDAQGQKATVIVSPSDAQRLVQAQARGRLQLALRPASDQAVVAVPTLRSERTEREAPVLPPARRPFVPAPQPEPEKADAAPPPAPAAAVITVIKGTQRETVVVRP